MKSRAEQVGEVANKLSMPAIDILPAVYAGVWYVDRVQPNTSRQQQLYAEHTKFWLLGATGSLLPVLFARTGGQAVSGTQTDSSAREPKSWCNLYIAS
jgi:hypothetical protein